MRLFSSTPKEFKSLFKTLQIKPGNIGLYRDALSHKSGKKHKRNYERLEFLGDAVLSSVMSDYIYQVYPSEKEGGLSKLRARVVNRKVLNQLGSKIKIQNYLDCDPSLLKDQSSIPGNALEALFGAIYLDKGYMKAYQAIMKLFTQNLDLNKILEEDTNYKSQLLEWGQKNKHNIRFESKEVELQKFSIDCFVNDELTGQAKDKNKKKGEQKAALKTLQKLNLI